MRRAAPLGSHGDPRRLSAIGLATMEQAEMTDQAWSASGLFGQGRWSMVRLQGAAEGVG